MQKFALQEKSLNLQEQMLAAQAAHLEAITSLQTDLQRSRMTGSNQYDNIQKQLEEEMLTTHARGCAKGRA